MTPIEALIALTSGGADAIGLADKGRITPGAVADVIAVEGDLSSEVRDVANVAYVWREGQLIRG
jgi:imidazolonepropionase-like amidohydrolase